MRTYIWNALRVWISDKLLSLSFWFLHRDSDEKHKMSFAIMTRYDKRPLESLEILFRDQLVFSIDAFGEDRSPTVFLNHLKTMVNETITDPFNKQYYAEILLLLIDSYVRSGGDPETLIKSAFEQLSANTKAFASTNTDD